ncbi:MAG: dihydrolipoamide acetyltransferase family protein [Candidatus Latescibacterota bacterium]
MATEVVMPKLGLTMERGTIGAWLKAEGDDVERGEPLLEVVTDKVTMEVEAQAAGVLRRILVEAGEEVDVATPIGVIAAVDEDITHFESRPPTPTVSTPSISIPQAAATPASPHGTGNGRRPHRASPKARRIAEEHGIVLDGIAGSGPSGRIVAADVEARVGAATPSVAGQAVELTRPQQIAAERLTASSQQAPHIYLETAVCAARLEQLRAAHAAQDRKVSYNDLILKAAAMALQEHPRVNSHFIDGHVHQQQTIDIGIAADTPQGLMVPVLRDVTARAIDDIAVESRRLVDRARHNRLSLDDLTTGSFTVSNLGMFGITRFTAIINPPQVAILAVGAIEPTVVALGTDGMAVRPMMFLTLSADHRAIDGAMGARFLQRLKDILENPGLLG